MTNDNQTTAPPHPMQPLVWDKDVIRFKRNAIVRFLLDAGPFDLNQIALMPFSDEDRAQFAQLIGYSVSGWGELGYCTEQQIEEADHAAEEGMRMQKPPEQTTKLAGGLGSWTEEKERLYGNPPRPPRISLKGYKLCTECNQPILRKGQERKRPDDYRHARGCPNAD